MIEIDHNLLNEYESEYTAVIVGRDLSSYLIALILKQHGYEVALVSQPKTPVLNDLYEYLSIKYLYEAARRLHSIHSLRGKGLEIKFDNIKNHFQWQKLTNECKQEFLNTKQSLEKQISEKKIAIYEGTIVMIEDYIVRVIEEGTNILKNEQEYICRFVIDN